MRVIIELIIFLIVIIFVYVIYFSTKKKKKDEATEEYIPLQIQISYNGENFIDEDSPSVNSEDIWLTHNQSVNIAGYQINDGFIYVGEGLRAVSNSTRAEPSLINPKLEVNTQSPDYPGNSMSYWPSYSNLSPQARAAYLDWLADGRKDPSINIGYVFLFFYGL